MVILITQTFTDTKLLRQDLSLTRVAALDIEAKEVRGLGLHMTKLVAAHGTAAAGVANTVASAASNAKAVAAASTAVPPLAAPVVRARRRQPTLSQHVNPKHHQHNAAVEEHTAHEQQQQHARALPPANELDADVLAALPATIQNELSRAYAATSTTAPAAAAHAETKSAKAKVILSHCRIL